MNEDLQITQAAPGWWDIENLTDEELASLYNAISNAPLPDRRNLYKLKQKIEELPII